MVSVIIPTLQEEQYLPNLLTSISNQTYQNTETIVSDSSPSESKEAIRQLIDEWSGLINIKMVDSLPKNVSAGRNAGAANTSGEMLLFIDADCIMEPDYIEKLVKDLENGAVLAHGLDCWYDNDLNNSIKSFYLWFKPRMHTTGRGVLIRKNDFDTLGGYREDLDPYRSNLREDLDLGQRVEDYFGQGSVYLDKDAVLAESCRRPLLTAMDKVSWSHRGWRKGTTIDRRFM